MSLEITSIKKKNSQKEQQAILAREYQWTVSGHLTRRQDSLRGLSEDFEYDAFNRIRASVRSYEGSGSEAVSPLRLSYDYDGRGNITNRADVGDYQYNGTQPHAVTRVDGAVGTRQYEYDELGRIVSGTYAVEWTAFGKPTRITRDTAETRFRYGPGRQRYWSWQYSGGSEPINRSTLYIGDRFERLIDHTESDAVTDRHYIYARGRQVATVEISRSDSEDEADEASLEVENRYLLRDHQGSVVAIVAGYGSEAYVAEKLDYGVWGNRRPATGGFASIGNVLFQVDPPDHSRGYTNHEHLDVIGLIHMNGRVYDPEIGRFLSPDPFVQFPESPLSYNRYSYALNAPLSYTDPSGYSLEDVAIGGAVAIATAYNPALGMAIAGATGYMQSGGNTKVALFSAAAAGASYGVGEVISAAGASAASAAVLQGIAQGGISYAGGGRFSDGFLGGMTGALTSANSGLFKTESGALLASMIAGGSLAELNGGSFTNGAVSAAFSFAVGRAADRQQPISEEDARRARVNAILDDIGAYYDEYGYFNGETLAFTDTIGAAWDVVTDVVHVKASFGVQAGAEVRGGLGTLGGRVRVFALEGELGSSGPIVLDQEISGTIGAPKIGQYTYGRGRSGVGSLQGPLESRYAVGRVSRNTQDDFVLGGRAELFLGVSVEVNLTRIRQHWEGTRGN